ncbi:MAG: cytochrome c [Pseudomonadales bacterium]|nr:cytochrome c [Halioglobus sp.]MCP5193804.1 cytochrome c [Pseudomonadales bacterium]
MRIIIAAVIGVIGLSLSTANAADLAAGRKKSEVCAACHGAIGFSSNTSWPNLAGQQKAYLVKQLKDFREGTRSDPWMSPMAKDLSDEDIENLATFYVSLPVCDKYQ